MRCAAPLLIGLLMLVMPACDRAAPSASSGNRNSPDGAHVPGKPVVKLTTLAPLVPDRRTHFTADQLGNIFWVQETDAGNDVLYSLGSGAIPQATRLTSASVLAALNVRDGTGNIQSVAAAPDEGIYFYFAGGAGRDVLACVGYFVSRTAQIRILATTPVIQSASGMVAALALARGEFVPTAAGASEANEMWLWISHTDGSAFLRFTSRPVPAANELKFRRPFRQIASNRRELTFSYDTCGVGAGPNDMLIIADLFNGTLWNVDSAGEATMSWSLVGLPSVMSSPAMDADGRTMLFAADADPIKERSAAQITAPLVDTTFPALLLLGKTDIAAIGRDEIQAYAGFPVYRLQLTGFIPEKGGKSWLSYDNSSGELVRVEVQQAPRD